MAFFDDLKGAKYAAQIILQSEQPLDARSIVDEYSDLAAMVDEHGAYEGMIVYVKEKADFYTLIDGEWVSLKLINFNDEDIAEIKERIEALQELIDEQIEFTQEEKDKLAGIDEGANNITVDSALSSTSTNPVQNKAVNTALNDKVPTTRTVNGHALSANITLGADDVGAIPSTDKGTAGGVAELDDSGKVPASQLPSYVDDVIEGYLSDNSFYEDSAYTTQITGESGKIYVDLATNKTYRWSGSAFTVISETLALGETASTAYRGDRGKTAYDHSQSEHAPSDAEKNIITGVQLNGSDLTVGSDRTVNVKVPTKTSELANDSDFITSSGTAAEAEKLADAVTIDGVGFDGSGAITHYGSCATAASTAAKAVEVADYVLSEGASVKVKFTVTNTASSPMLNVNGTGAKSILYRGSAVPAGTLAANRTYEFVYNGSAYELVGDLDTDTTYSAATTSEAGLMSADDKAKVDAMPSITVSSTAPTTAAPNSLWFDIAE